MENRVVDVAIVGGGISGLAAAYYLHKRDPGLKVLVLEAKDRVGGRTLTVPIKSKYGVDHWDIGGQWVARSQTHIMDLIEELGFETYRQYTEGVKFMQLGGDKISSYRSDIPSLSVLALIDLQLFIMKVERLRKTIVAASPYSCKNAEEWDATSMDTFINQSLWTQGAKDSVYAALRCTLTVEASQVSLLYFLTTVASANGILKLFEATGDAAQSLKVKGGTQQISKKMAEKIGSRNVLLNQLVDSIIQSEDHVILECRSGLQVKADRVILAIPSTVISKIDFEPVLPLEKVEIHKRMPFGNYIKILVTYKQAFWRDSGHSGEIVTHGGPSTTSRCDTGPLCIVFDATSPKKSPALVAFIAGYQAIQWGRQDLQTRRDAVLKSLASFLGEEALSCIAYHEKDWREDRFIEGAVSAVGTGAMHYFSEGLRRPFRRLHFAGSETATEWIGYMSGGVQAGQRAANEVLYNIKPRLLRPNEANEVLMNSYQPIQNIPLMPSRTGNSLSKMTVLLSLTIVVMAVLGFYWYSANNVMFQ